MNRMALWLANAVLLVLACAVTAWVVRQSPAATTVSDAKADAKTSRAERKAERKGAAKESSEPSARQGVAAPEDVDTLWQQTLFRQERTEDVTQPPAEDAAAGAAAVDLELVGLACIGERSVAIIVQNRGQPRRVAPAAANTPAGKAAARRPGAARPVAAPPSAPAAAAEGPPDRHVYKIGDKIGDSGYTLKDIRLKEKEAVLVRGSEERVLKLDATDDQSAARREVAAAQETPPPAPKPAAEAAHPAAAKPPAEAGNAAGAAAATGQPAPGGEGAPVLPLSREERLERARQLRERILQGRPPTNTTN